MAKLRAKSNKPAAAAPTIADRGNGGELHQIAGADADTLTTQQGIPVADDQNSLATQATHDDLILWLAFKEAKALLAELGTSGK